MRRTDEGVAVRFADPPGRHCRQLRPDLREGVRSAQRTLPGRLRPRDRKQGFRDRAPNGAWQPSNTLETCASCRGDLCGIVVQDQQSGSMDGRQGIDPAGIVDELDLVGCVAERPA